MTALLAWLTIIGVVFGYVEYALEALALALRLW